MCSNTNTRFLMRLIIDILLLTSVYCVALVILPQQVRTQQRGFFCGDETLAYPYKSETFLKRLHITIMVIAIPAALILCIEMLRVAFSSNKSYSTADYAAPKSAQHHQFVGVNIPTFVSESYNTLGIYLFGLALVLIITTVTKAATGRLAPYFLEVCQPLLGGNITACSNTKHFGIYLENYSCSSLTSSEHLLTIMRQSFPSSHASSTAYAMLFLAIYFQARLQTGWLLLWRTILQISTVLISLWVAFERVSNHRHHWSDVVAGLAVGYFMAIFMTLFVMQLFKKIPVKVQRLREEPSFISPYAYYTVIPRPRYC